MNGNKCYGCSLFIRKLCWCNRLHILCMYKNKKKCTEIIFMSIYIFISKLSDFPFHLDVFSLNKKLLLIFPTFLEHWGKNRLVRLKVFSLCDIQVLIGSECASLTDNKYQQDCLRLLIMILSLEAKGPMKINNKHFFDWFSTRLDLWASSIFYLY